MQTNFEFSKNLKALNMDILTTDKIEKIIKYIDFLKSANKKINLISRKAADEDIFKFIESSLVFVKYIRRLNPQTILDMGSGSGFPAVICAICFPGIKFSVVDSTQKKVDFLYDVALFLELTNIECFWGRVEDFAKSKTLKENFDVVSAMAVGGIELTTNYALPFLKEKGIFLTIKSCNQEQEFEKAKNYINKMSASFDLYKEVSIESWMILIGKNHVKNTEKPS